MKINNLSAKLVHISQSQADAKSENAGSNGGAEYRITIDLIYNMLLSP